MSHPIQLRRRARQRNARRRVHLAATIRNAVSSEMVEGVFRGDEFFSLFHVDETEEPLGD